MAATTDVFGLAGRGQDSNTLRKLAHSLGWLSVGLGVTEIVAPRAFAKLEGISRHTPDKLKKFRKLASGVGLLAKPQPSLNFWTRIGGELLQFANSRRAARSRGSGARIAATVAAVGGATALGAVLIKKSRAGSVSHRSMQHSASVAINRPIEECYRYWRDPQKLPTFFKNLKEVHTIGNDRLELVTRGPKGQEISRAMIVTEDVPNQSLAWRSIEDRRFTESGSVRFEPLAGGKGTIVRLHVSHEIPSATARVVTSLLGHDPALRLRKTLLRFKQMLEAGEIATTEGQPAGRSAGTTWLDTVASI